jgi:thiol-disulfide isomerase/thioredoxin
LHLGCKLVGLQPFSLFTRLSTIMVHFFLYSRSYCHLCDDMLNALQELKLEYDFSVEVLDVDTDDALLEQYDELVPVLVARSAANVKTEQLCHYFLDAPRVRAFLAADQDCPLT